MFGTFQDSLRQPERDLLVRPESNAFIVLLDKDTPERALSPMELVRYKLYSVSMFPQPINELSPIVAPHLTVILVIEEQSLNALFPMDVHRPMLLFVNAEQPKNALFPILVLLYRSYTVRSLLQFSKQLFGISQPEDGNVTLVKLAQSLNCPLPLLSMDNAEELLMFAVTSPLPANASFPIPLTVEGIVIELNEVQF